MTTSSLNAHALLRASLNLPGLRRGKVRDVYTLPQSPGPDRVLIVATDRLSAFDVIMPTPVPGKGRILTQISTFWFEFVQSHKLCEHHLISTDAAQIPDAAFEGQVAEGPITPRSDLEGRVMIARAAKVVPIECVCRGYLEGSGWKEYQTTGKVCGVPLPAGLRHCDRLPTPIFTPATKEEGGAHDMNISFDQACALVGGPLMETLRTLTLAIYSAAAAHAQARGIIIADTKFEFGLPIEADGAPAPDAQPILIDEVLTPDSSRFWPLDVYAPGRAQPSYDKQFVREHLELLVARDLWHKAPPGPDLPPEVITLTLAKYREARDRLLK